MLSRFFPGSGGSSQQSARPKTSPLSPMAKPFTMATRAASSSASADGGDDDQTDHDRHQDNEMLPLQEQQRPVLSPIRTGRGGGSAPAGSDAAALGGQQLSPTAATPRPAASGTPTAAGARPLAESDAHFRDVMGGRDQVPAGEHAVQAALEGLSVVPTPPFVPRESGGESAAPAGAAVVARPTFEEQQAEGRRHHRLMQLQPPLTEQQGTEDEGQQMHQPQHWHPSEGTYQPQQQQSFVQPPPPGQLPQGVPWGFGGPGGLGSGGPGGGPGGFVALDALPQLLEDLASCGSLASEHAQAVINLVQDHARRQATGGGGPPGGPGPPPYPPFPSTDSSAGPWPHAASGGGGPPPPPPPPPLRGSWEAAAGGMPVAAQFSASAGSAFGTPSGAPPPPIFNQLGGGGDAASGGGGGGGAASDSTGAAAASSAAAAARVAGTAQVAVHNVPFKWCNTDLEGLFHGLPGFKDAQLLFHDNGRSKGVGVALFDSRATAEGAVEALSGRQADGRRLDLLVMSPDNHISFSSCKVAILGLPWEFSAADVRTLLETTLSQVAASAREQSAAFQAGAAPPPHPLSAAHDALAAGAAGGAAAARAACARPARDPVAGSSALLSNSGGGGGQLGDVSRHSTESNVSVTSSVTAAGDELVPWGVEDVEVVYRDDGKSEGRAVATFSSRAAARAAIRALHGKETLSGLRMRLFFLHQHRSEDEARVAAAVAAPAAPASLRNDTAVGLPPSGPAAAAAAAGAGSAGHSPLAAAGLVGALLSPSPPPPGGRSGAGSAAASEGAGAVGGGLGGLLGYSGGGGGGPAAAGGFCYPPLTGSPAAGYGPFGAAAGGAAGGLLPFGFSDPSSGAGQPSCSAYDSASGGITGVTGSTTAPAPGDDEGPVILHVSGLVEGVTREQLRELFSQAGEVTKVDIPDGGRSMGYGFITFANPSAAQQAMLLLNNYPLGDGAIHIAYSTSATAKARQQALRQAKRSALARTAAAAATGGMLSTTGGLGSRGGTVTPESGGRSARASDDSSCFGGFSGFSGFPAAGGLGGGGGGLYGGMGGAADASAVGAGLPWGLGDVGSSASGDYGPSPGVLGRYSTGAAGAAGPGAFVRAPPGGYGGLGTPMPHRPPVWRGTSQPGTPGGGGLSGAAGGGLGGAGIGGLPPRGLFVTAFGGTAGPRPATDPGAAPDSRRASFDGAAAALLGPASGGPAALPRGGAGEAAAGAALPLQGVSRQVYVSGLPAQLDEGQLLQLFSQVGPVEQVRKPRNKEYGFVRFVHADSAIAAVHHLDGAQLPGGGRLFVQFSTSALDRPLPRHLQQPAGAGAAPPEEPTAGSGPRGSAAGDGGAVAAALQQPGSGGLFGSGGMPGAAGPFGGSVGLPFSGAGPGLGLGGIPELPGTPQRGGGLLGPTSASGSLLAAHTAALPGTPGGGLLSPAAAALAGGLPTGPGAEGGFGSLGPFGLGLGGGGGGPPLSPSPGGLLSLTAAGAQEAFDSAGGGAGGLFAQHHAAVAAGRLSPSPGGGAAGDSGSARRAALASGTAGGAGGAFFASRQAHLMELQQQRRQLSEAAAAAAAAGGGGSLSPAGGFPMQQPGGAAGALLDFGGGPPHGGLLPAGLALGGLPHASAGGGSPLPLGFSAGGGGGFPGSAHRMSAGSGLGFGVAGVGGGATPPSPFAAHAVAQTAGHALEASGLLGHPGSPFSFPAGGGGRQLPSDLGCPPPDDAGAGDAGADLEASALMARLQQLEMQQQTMAEDMPLAGGLTGAAAEPFALLHSLLAADSPNLASGGGADAGAFHLAPSPVVSRGSAGDGDAATAGSGGGAGSGRRSAGSSSEDSEGSQRVQRMGAGAFLPAEL